VETLAAHRAEHDLSPAQALQRAMQTVRSGKRPDGSPMKVWSPDWSHPAMWAPFSLIANNGNRRIRRDHPGAAEGHLWAGAGGIFG
tara:strand:- start:36094 stop:36351 length:258 start_codon:yes stop_codon:yes gene_type:complete